MMERLGIPGSFPTMPSQVCFVVLVDVVSYPPVGANIVSWILGFHVDQNPELVLARILRRGPAFSNLGLPCAFASCLYLNLDSPGSIRVAGEYVDGWHVSGEAHSIRALSIEFSHYERLACPAHLLLVRFDRCDSHPVPVGVSSKWLIFPKWLVAGDRITSDGGREALGASPRSSRSEGCEGEF